MRRSRSWLFGLGVALTSVLGLGDRSLGEVVTLKTGQNLEGLMDKDGTLVQVYDPEGVLRYVFRDSKIESIREETVPKGERFQLVQPMTVHAGAMPEYAVNVESTPWDAFGRRKFSFQSSRSGSRTEMTQALIELTPFSAKLRGVDGFWLGRVDINQVPREVILGLLAKVDQSNQNERLRVGRFLIQAEWFD
ncbi:MAG TPA: hypothetical protein VFT74_21935, partial [Isosphaeraceae bacterium]|nr:hypothetical protein [Isosphaeraceae bacterium]